jgi:hypothetical protein
MKWFYFSLPLCVLALTSCETTGDPTQGGLFGWSQNKADYRIQERRDALYHIQNDTDAQLRRTQQLEAQRNRLQR